MISLLSSILSMPYKLKLNMKPLALIVYVRSFWWYSWVPGQKGVRAMALGNVVLMSKKTLAKDLAHELVHVVQHQREPFIHPFLYAVETIRHGYRQNKYEDEAYTTAGNRYVGHPL
jgi:hypothetical protein